MKYLDEYRDGEVAARARRDGSPQTATRPWVLMEVCGGQTHSIVRYGIDRMLPPDDRAGARPRVSGLRDVARDDRPAHAIAAGRTSSSPPSATCCACPGSRGDLLHAASRGADVRVVYSPLDAVRIAREHPDQQVVFFGIGFETTAPANAMAVYPGQARRA